MIAIPFVDSYLLILLEFAVKSGLIVLIAWAANQMMGGGSPARENWIWRGGLLATVILIPIGIWIGGLDFFRILGAKTSSAIVAWSSIPPIIPVVQSMLAVLKVSLLIAYLTGAAFLLCKLALGLALQLRLIRNSTPVAALRVHETLRDLSSRLSLDRRVEILVNQEIKTPLSTCILGAHVFLPDNWESWDSQKLESVLAHELSHIRRNDSWFGLLSEIVAATLWFIPTAWLLRRRLATTMELACDSESVTCTDSPTQYAKHLLELAAHANGDNTYLGSLAVPMADRSRLSKRIETLLAMQPVARIDFWSWRSFFAASVLASLTFAVLSIQFFPGTRLSLTPPVSISDEQFDRLNRVARAFGVRDRSSRRSSSLSERSSPSNSPSPSPSPSPSNSPSPSPSPSPSD